MTTLGRALGIPSRPTTAFQSAHDTDRNRAIDKFYDPEWNPVSGITSDSIWSFHVTLAPADPSGMSGAGP